MNTIKLFALLIIGLVFVQCKSVAPTAGTPTNASVLEVHQLLDSTQSQFLYYADKTGGDVREAIIRTVSWLNSEPGVASAGTSDSLYIDITLNSGLTTSFYFEEVDDNGNDVFRGGGPSGALNSPPALSGTHSTNTITNKKVLIFAADTKTLSQVIPQISRTVSRMNAAGLGLDVTVLKDDQCSYGVVEHFGDYGLVILDTHGEKDGFLVGSKLDLSIAPTSEADLNAKITAQVGAGAYDKLSAGSLKLAKSVKANPKKPNWQKSVIPQEDRTLWFTSKYLNLLPAMPNTVILGNMCYSGWGVASYGYSWPTTYDTLVSGMIQTHRGGSGICTTDPIKSAFMNRQPISYYCYAYADGSSTAVQDSFAAAREDSLIARFVRDLDSTKVVNLLADNITEYFDSYQYYNPRARANVTIPNLYFKHYGADTYSYDPGCVTQFTDARDGHVYKAVCINGQNWMAENLDFNATGSLCYANTSGDCDVYGRLYDWATLMQGADSSSKTPSGVQGVCPKGWHVPSYDEIVKLINYVGGKSGLAGTELRAPTTWLNNGGGTNSSGFTALAAGDYAPTATVPFASLGLRTFFWTASTVDIYNHKGFFTVVGGQEPVLWGGEDPTLAFSCRCLKDP